MKETTKAHTSRLRNGDYAYLTGRVLDIGCGDDPLTLTDGTVEPYDHSLGHRDAATLPEIADESVDNIWSSHCIEHCSDVPTALRNWARVLKPGGHIICAWPDFLLYEHGQWPSQHNSDHRHAATLFDIPGIPAHVWTFKRLRAAAADCGLDLIDARVTCDNYDFRRMSDRSFDQTRGAALAQCTFIFRKNESDAKTWTEGEGALSLPPASEHRHAIALHRPGAIGDIIMTLNLIPAFKAANPGAAIHYYCDRTIGEGLRSLMLLVGVDEVRDCETLDRSQYQRTINLIGYPVAAENYPHAPMRKHLLRYFADEMGLKGQINPVQLSKPPNILNMTYATLHVRAGWSKYKEWPMAHWCEVVRQLPEIHFVQVGGDSDSKIEGARHEYLGDMPASLSLIANARIHVGIDSFPQHAAHLFGVPSVVLWGSTQSSAAGYPESTHVEIRDMPCRLAGCFRENPAISRAAKGPCVTPPRATYEDNTPHACMAGITVEQVVAAIRSKWAAVTA